MYLPKSPKLGEHLYLWGYPVSLIYKMVRTDPNEEFIALKKRVIMLEERLDRVDRVRREWIWAQDQLQEKLHSCEKRLNELEGKKTYSETDPPLFIIRGW